MPFSVVPFQAGYAGWLVGCVVAYALALWLAVRFAGLPRAVWAQPILLALVFTYSGFAEALHLSQISPFLAPLVVLAWGLLRRDRSVSAAALLGVVIVLKLALLPLGALVLVRRRWQEPLAALGGAAGISAVVAPFTGVRAYAEWLHLLCTVDYTQLDVRNVSVVGLLFRTIHPAPPARLALLINVVAVAVAVLVVLPRVPEPWHPTDWRFSVLLLVALLGWDHYGPLLIPLFVSVLATWPRLTSAARASLATGLALLFLATEVHVAAGMVGLAIPLGTILCAGLTLTAISLAAELLPRARRACEALPRIVPAGD